MPKSSKRVLVQVNLLSFVLSLRFNITLGPVLFTVSKKILVFLPCPSLLRGVFQFENLRVLGDNEIERGRYVP